VSGLFALHAPNLSHPRSWDSHTLLACIAACIVIENVAFLALRLRYAQDARTPIDERERLIHLKATRLAARCYLVACFLAIFTIHLGASAPFIAYYRRGV